MRSTYDWRDLIPPRTRDWQWPPRWLGCRCITRTLTTNDWLTRRRTLHVYV